MEAKKAPNEKTDNVIDTFETWIAWKKNIQCNAINNPTKISFRKERMGMRKDFFLKRRNSAKKTAAKNILYHTIASAVIVIKAPNIAVKPQINTIKCRFK
jgi:hypothetical protein